MEGQNKPSPEEVVVEKRVARRVIRRRRETMEEAPESKKDEQNNLVLQKTEPMKEVSVPTPSSQDLQTPEEIKVAKTEETPQALSPQEKIISTKEKEKKIPFEQRKNLTFKDRIQGTISLEKIRPKSAGEKEDEDTEEKKQEKAKHFQQLPEEKKERPAKVKRGVKTIGGDLDIEGQGKATTLTHLVRTTVRERIFRPDAVSRGKKKIISRKSIKQTQITTKKTSKRIIEMAETITVANLSQQLGVKAAEVIKKLMDLNIMVTINQNIDQDTATLVVQDYGYTIKDTAFREEEILGSEPEEQKEVDENLKTRPAIVTVMGHVDHGKTSLLDAIRSTSVTEGESGGITQHIGAYTVKIPNGQITFLDTPGHEAFTAMRARGANATDIVILVVAADDGLMPQTEESISHAQAAKVPIIVAINKMDKPEAKPDVVLRQLSEKGLLAEEWGGEILVVKVSAKTKEGIPQFLESILLQAEMLELKADPNRKATGIVLEAKLEKGRGPVCTLLVQNGTLRVGDALVAGECAAKVRAMQDWTGASLKEAGPSTAVEILGLENLPQASDTFHVVDSEQDAKKVAEHRQAQRRQQEGKATAVSLEDMFAQMKAGQVKECHLILKADAQGSIEAIEQAIEKIGNEEVKPKILHKGIGAINESDVTLAAASQGIIIGFHVRPETKALHLAKEKGVEVKLYKIIYDLVDEVKQALSGLLAPTVKENYLGRAEVRQTFQVSKQGTIAGCMVVDGILKRGAKLRLLRDNVVIHEGQISTLQRFKDEAREVKEGFECGVAIEGYQNIQAADVIEAFELEEIKRTL